MIKISLPPSINATYKRNGRNIYKSEEAKTWERLAGYELMAQKPPRNLTGAIYVGIEMFFVRDRDVDSSTKILLDLLQKQGIYKNDSQVTHLNVKKYRVEKGEQRCEIEVHQTSI